MRRIVIALGATLSGLVLLLSWPTSLNQTVNQAAGTGGTDAAGTGTGPAGTDTDDDGSSAGSTLEGPATEGTEDGSSGTTSGQATDGGTSSGTSGEGAATSGTATYTGAAADTRYGPVQVEITVADGVLVSATAIDFPMRDRHDQQINSYAIPILQSETVDAQGSAIDMVSGATVTSRAYIQSLQDALDQAGL